MSWEVEVWFKFKPCFETNGMFSIFWMLPDHLTIVVDIGPKVFA